MKKKLIALLITIAVIGTCVVVDLIKMNMVTLEIVSVTPEPAVADPSQSVEIVVQLTSFTGAAIPDHNLYAITKNGGSFQSYRVKTDENGRATMIYYPYKATEYQTARDVTIQIRDEDNSIFIEMYPSVSYTIAMKKNDGNSHGVSLEDILGGGGNGK